MKKDIFICHASEDKIAVARPLASSLFDRGISFWIDEAEILVGDSIAEKVNEGLKVSEFVVVILSRAFLEKKWPQSELWAVLNSEAKSGKVTILPILVCSASEVDSLLGEFPLLSGKLFLLWNGDSNKVANDVQASVLKSRGISSSIRVKMHSCGHCATPFQHGVHICLGCQGRIIYGLNGGERLEIRKRALSVIGLIFFFMIVLIPTYSESWFGFKIPPMWGFGLWVIPVSVILAIVGAFHVEARVASKKSHLVRTFR